MKNLKMGLLSFCVGLILSFAPIIAYATCARTTKDEVGTTCTLAGQSCNADGSVCACSYICGPVT